ncbi:MAG: hypothetical protein K2Q18_16810 [Bdellovibrionales bacterium]|nr:hypothetical protein [Bdellovibrionales bacterium]
MALKNKIIAIFILLNASFASEAKIILHELLTKQAVGNIRFLSQDGKFTYYQKRSGSLLFSTNYKVIEFLKGKVGTQYTVIGSRARKKIAIMQNENFHNLYSQRAKEKIYLLNFGDTKPFEIGFGGSAQLHLDDAWLSYYDSYAKTIYFVNTDSPALKFSIKLNNKINPYFTPQVVMSDDDTIYYTDLGETGSFGLLQYKRSLAKAEIIFKSHTPMVKAEICINNNSLIMGIFGINLSKEGTYISKSPLPLEDFSKRKAIYISLTNDAGQMICDYGTNSVTVIKNFGTNDNYKTDLIDINTENKEITQLSELNTVTSVINMDGTLLALDKGKYFIVKGTMDYKNVDSLRSLPPSGAIEEIKKIDGL